MTRRRLSFSKCHQTVGQLVPRCQRTNAGIPQCPTLLSPDNRDWAWLWQAVTRLSPRDTSKQDADLSRIAHYSAPATGGHICVSKSGESYSFDPTDVVRNFRLHLSEFLQRLLDENGQVARFLRYHVSHTGFRDGKMRVLGNRLGETAAVHALEGNVVRQTQVPQPAPTLLDTQGAESFIRKLDPA